MILDTRTAVAFFVAGLIAAIAMLHVRTDIITLSRHFQVSFLGSSADNTKSFFPPEAGPPKARYHGLHG